MHSLLRKIIAIDEFFIIGGAEVYKAAFPTVEQVYLTRVDIDAGCDTFFHQVDWNEWVLLEYGCHPADEKNEVPFEFFRYLRKNPELA